MNAKQNIYILSYIFADDKIGKEIKNILKYKAKKGVDVVVIYDSFGSKNTKRVFFNEMKKIGIKVLEFFPPFFKLKFLQLDINYRNHRKIIIIDNFIAYVGGLNIRDDHLGLKKELSPWRDTHIKIVGESVIELLKVFLNDLNLCKKVKINIKNIPLFNNGKIKTQILNSSPLYSHSKIGESIINAINNAKKSVYIQTPYLILDDKTINALKNTKFSGKNVVIIIPKLKDKNFVYNVSLYYAKLLIDVGIKVYLFKGFLHSKCMVIDKDIFLVGSSNFDMRSFYLNFETSVMIFDKSISEKYYNIIQEDLSNSEELTLNFYKKLPINKRLAISFSKLFAPIL
ncbi:MAG: cardiolipin synthase [Clostridiales bacterium]|nr:cardiolipin synthase [Clostridiales bacterium]